jgi:hypothetical protein
MRTRFKLGMAVGAIALGFAAAKPASAAITNGGFEGFPDFTGWQTTGNTTIQASDFRVPAEGSQQGLLATGPGATTGGSNPVTAASLETFLGLAAGTLAPGMNATEGSAIKQTSITAAAGDTITFSYDFATNEPRVQGNNDFGFVTLNGVLTKLADTTDATNAPPAIDISGNNAGINSFARETGYKTFTLTIAAAGTYTLGFGVVDVQDTAVDSVLLVDGITQQAGGGGGVVIPLPAGLYVLPLGLALAGLYSAKLRRAAAAV